MRHYRKGLVRLLGWVVAGLASLLTFSTVVVTIYLLFFDYSAHLKAWIENEAGRVLGRRVSIQEFLVDFPNTFELRGVRAESRTSGAPWLELGTLRGELSLAGILRREVRLNLVEVQKLVLRVEDYGGGQVDLPGLWGPPQSKGRLIDAAAVTLLAERVHLEDARFEYHNHSIPWQLQAAGVRVTLNREGQDYKGVLSYESGRLQVHERPPFEGSLAATFGLSGKILDVESLSAEGSFYHLESRGQVSLGADPQASLDVHLASELGPAVRSLLGWGRLEGEGQSTFSGTLRMGRGWHVLRGDLRVPGGNFAGVPLREWSAALFWDRSVFEISQAQGSIAGGTSRLTFHQPLPSGAQSARLTAELDNVDLEAFTLALSGKPSPLASRVSGNARLSFALASPMQASGNIDVIGRVPESAERTGVEFSAQGVVTNGSLRLNRGRFRTESLMAELSGDYPWSGPADLDLDLEIYDLARADELQTALRNLLDRKEPAARVNLSGRGRATGKLTGRFPKMSFTGDVLGSDVRFRGLELGQVEARGTLGEQSLRLERLKAVREGAFFEGSGQAALPDPLASWTLSGALSDWPAQDLARVTPLALGLEGRVSGEGSFRCRENQVEGKGSLVVTSGSVRGEPFERAEVGIQIQRKGIVLDPISVSRDRARARGTVELDLETRSVRGEITGQNLDVTGRGPLPIRGEIDVHLRLAGTMEEPNLDIEASSGSLELAGTSLGAARGELSLRGEVVVGTLVLKGQELALEAHSATHLLPGYPTEGHVEWRDIDLGSWIRTGLAGVPGAFKFISSGEASFEGSLLSPRSLTADAQLTSVELDVSNFELTSPDPFTVRMRDGSLETAGMRMVGKGTEVEVTGRLPILGGGMDAQVRGQVNLDLLQSLFPSVASSGQAYLAAQIQGSWERPVLTGHADIEAGSIRLREFPQAFGDIRGRFRFDNRTIRFADLQARFGGAPVTSWGSVVLRGLGPESFDIRASGKSLKLHYPEGLAATVDADLSVSGTPRAPVLSGHIEVSDAAWTREYDLATGILIQRQSDALKLLEEVEEESPLSNLRFDVEVHAPGTLRVRNSRASIDAGAELQLRGTFPHPALTGHCEALRGEVFLLGQRYELRSGKVDFIDPNSIKPFFDVLAESRVRSYRIELRLTGTPERFFPELSSDPPLRTVDILRLLAGASERDVLIGSEEEEVAGVGVASLLTERLTQEVGRRAERLFGLDRFSIDPFLVGQFANPTARVSMGKQIYRDLSVNYSTNLNSATETLILIEYTPQGPVSWIVSRDEEGAFGIDLRFRKSF